MSVENEDLGGLSKLKMAESVNSTVTGLFLANNIAFSVAAKPFSKNIKVSYRQNKIGFSFIVSMIE